MKDIATQYNSIAKGVASQGIPATLPVGIVTAMGDDHTLTYCDGEWVFGDAADAASPRIFTRDPEVAGRWLAELLSERAPRVALRLVRGVTER